MEVIEKHQTALQCQIHEAVLIITAGKWVKLLNSKSEWNSQELSRLVIEEDEDNRRRKMNEKDMSQGKLL